MAKPDPGTGPRKRPGFVAVLLTTASLLAGVVAAFQLREFLWPSSRPSTAPTNAPLPKQAKVALAGGAWIELPEGWSLADPEVVAARFPSAARLMDQGSGDVTFLEGPQATDSSSEVFGSAVWAGDLGGMTLADAADIERRETGCLLARVIETQAGSAMHTVVRNEPPYGEGPASIAESFLWEQQGRTFRLMLSCNEHDHLRNTETFRRMADSVELDAPPSGE